MSTQNQISLMSLFEVGAHRGNRKSRSNPILKPYLYGVSSGICLIDLAKTKSTIERTEEFMYKLGQKKRQILVVGTSKHLAEITPEYAGKFSNGGMPYVNNRWLGGLLTNWATIKKTLKNKAKLEKVKADEEFFHKLARNEQLRIDRELAKLEATFGGLANLKSNRPGAVLVIDALHDPVSIREAQTMSSPIIALTNTSSQVLPKNLKNTIVCNTNSINTLKLVLNRLVDAYNKGLSDGVEISSEQNSDTNENKPKK